jgi:hypothetical protein
MIKETVRRTLTSLALLIPLVAFAEPYKSPSIADVPTKAHSEGYLRLSDRTIQYSLSYQTDSSGINPSLYRAYNPDHVKYVIKDSFKLLIEFLEDRDINHADCRFDYNIHIFVLEKSILYEMERFPSVYSIHGPKLPGMWGLYTPTAEIDANSGIMVTNQGSSKNDAILVHELSHYWYDRMCLIRFWELDPKTEPNKYSRSKNSAGYYAENFALSFENYYEARR